MHVRGRTNLVLAFFSFFLFLFLSLYISIPFTIRLNLHRLSLPWLWNRVRSFFLFFSICFASINFNKLKSLILSMSFCLFSAHTWMCILCHELSLMHINHFVEFLNYYNKFRNVLCLHIRIIIIRYAMQLKEPKMDTDGTKYKYKYKYDISVIKFVIEWNVEVVSFIQTAQIYDNRNGFSHSNAICAASSPPHTSNVVIMQLTDLFATSWCC